MAARCPGPGPVRGHPPGGTWASSGRGGMSPQWRTAATLATIRECKWRARRAASSWSLLHRQVLAHRAQAVATIGVLCWSLRSSATPDCGPYLLAYRSGPRCTTDRLPTSTTLARGVWDDFTAKDFRTCIATGGSPWALLSRSSPAGSDSARKRASPACPRVSGYLGNTLAVARRPTSTPRVIGF